MVMMKTTKHGGRRLSVAEAKAKLSEALRDVANGPTIIHNRGRDVAVLIDAEAYSQLVGSDGGDVSPMRAFLHDVDALKRRFGGGTELEVERASIIAQDPFARTRR
jgi:prevent-host-death family protein